MLKTKVKSIAPRKLKQSNIAFAGRNPTIGWMYYVLNDGTVVHHDTWNNRFLQLK